MNAADRTRHPALGPLLGFVAAFVDVVGYIVLFGLFTAHATGNYVLLAVSFATDSPDALAKVLSIPAFIAVVAAASLTADAIERGGIDPLRPMLAVEAALVLVFLNVLRVVPLDGPSTRGTLVAGAVGVAAIGVQNAVMRRLLPTSTPSTVMTSALTQATVDVTALLWRERHHAARARLRRSLPVIGSFGLGAAVAGVAYAAVGVVSLVVPIAALLVAIAIGRPR